MSKRRPKPPHSRRAKPKKPRTRMVPERPHHQTSSRLLLLPPELRNRIFEYVVTEKNEIQLGTDLREPAIASVCRQFRREARLLWFTCNEFNLMVYEYDGKLHLKWADLVTALGIRNVVNINLTFSKTSQGNWANLRPWLRGSWERRINVGFAPLEPDDSVTAWLFFQTAQELLKLFWRRPWEEYEAIIEKVRRLEVVTSGHWKD